MPREGSYEGDQCHMTGRSGDGTNGSSRPAEEDTHLRLVEDELEVFTPTARPFLKWAGGKQWLAPIADRLLSPNFSGTYYEPLLGGGAIFFALSPSQSVLCDTNEELIATYQALRDDVDSVIALLRRYPHSRVFFEQIRRRKPRTPATVAARFIYLNKTAFNGLYRVNLRGEFNVPFGRYVNPSICQEARLREAAAALVNADLRCADFERAVADAGPGDFVYLDPPYITGHTNNGFLKYNAHLFSWEDQERLSHVARDLQNRGVSVLVTNADHPAVAELYEDSFRRYRAQRRSLIGGVGSVRSNVYETLLSSYPLAGMEVNEI